MKDSTHYKNTIIYICSILFMGFALYFYASYRNEPYIVPYPKDILIRIKDIISTTNTYKILWHSIYTLFESIIISFFFAMILGIIAGLFNWVYKFLKPIMSVLRITPLVAVVVIVAGIVGMKKAPLILSTLVVIPIIYEAFYKGITNIPDDLNDVWKLETKLNISVIKMIHLPLIAPFITMSITQSIGFGFKVLIISEFIIGINNSIGHEIQINNQLIQTDTVFAWTIISIIIVVAMEFISKLLAKCFIKE